LFRLTEFAIDGNRLNHRMHNKLLVADNQLAIIGGRNIGDEYFGQSKDWNFIDTDILLAGTVVPELSIGFDAYWNSFWAYPVKSMLNSSFLTGDLVRTREKIHERLVERPDLYTLAASVSFEDTLQNLLKSPSLVSTQLLVDDPDVSWFERPDEMAEELADLAMEIESEVIIVTAYLIPTSNLLEIARVLISRGVKINILTNSLATNNHTSAHAAYSKYRQQILDMGIGIYEMRHDGNMIAEMGTTGFTLHSKYIIFDDDIVFIGSLNLDPRSLYLNTELGVMMESPDLVRVLRVDFEEMIKPENSYQLLNTSEGIEWHSNAGVETRDPAKNSWQRFMFRLFRLLPISSQL
jgi:putative cardiolipin synthase